MPSTIIRTNKKRPIVSSLLQISSFYLLFRVWKRILYSKMTAPLDFPRPRARNFPRFFRLFGARDNIQFLPHPVPPPLPYLTAGSGGGLPLGSPRTRPPNAAVPPGTPKASRAPHFRQNKKAIPFGMTFCSGGDKRDTPQASLAPCRRKAVWLRQTGCTRCSHRAYARKLRAIEPLTS